MALTDKLAAIANAIRGKFGGTAKLTLDQMATTISSIPTKAATTYSPKTTAQTISAGTYLTGAQTIAATTGTAAVANVLKGKTFNSANGIGLTGTMTDNGAKTASLNCGGSYTIPAGYHNGSGKITANSLASQTAGTATAANILTGKTAWVGGTQLTGTMADHSASKHTITTSTSDQTKGAFRLNGTDLEIVPAIGFWGRWDWTVSHLKIAGSTLASAIGLTAAKIVKGNTILGIAGTASNIDVSGGMVTGSWTKSKGTVTVSSITGGVRMKHTGTDGTYSHVTLSSTIDLTNLTAIAITVNAVGGTYIGAGYHTVMTVRSSKPTGNLYTTEANTVTITGKGTFILNVSSLTGKYYLTVQPSYKTNAYIDVTRLIAF